MTSTDREDLHICYNKGCGFKFNLNNNKEDSCCHHPGAPVFHDAYKGWSCCNKKSTDFTTFLNMKGCTFGKHNPVKPEEPEKQKPDLENKDEIIIVCPPKEVDMSRPDFEADMEKLKVATTPSLKDALGKINENATKLNDEEISLVVKIGELCKNNGCQTSYEGEESNLSICKYHPGVPIFHEGLKYWLCCKKKTTDFDVFLQQAGCTTGSHLWIKKDVQKATCRYDWHQTGSFVFVTVYAKLVQPELSFIDANPVRLSLRIIFEEKQEFFLDNELGGIIVPNESSVSMAATKVEIKLRKAETKHWSKIFLPPKKEEKSEAEEIENNDDTCVGVDALDLSDI